MDKIKVIAFYLPQYHPFKENDEWWGKGFTEWTNVAKAPKLFPGHYQPKIPADLGFYDLRLPIVRKEQADLARSAGIDGFCYWHYWFGNGKRLMHEIFDDVLDSGDPDFPFCLAWANHSWYAKLWNKDNTQKDRLLIEQTYPGETDIEEHFAYLLKAFNDHRYIKYEGAPVFVIFNPHDMPYEYIHRFQALAAINGIEKGIYFVANITRNDENIDELLSNGYSAVTYQRLTSKSIDDFASRAIRKTKKYFLNKCLRLPTIANYEKAIEYLIQEDIDKNEQVIPTLIPNWDHTPRSGINGSLFINSTPQNFYKLVKKACSVVRNKKNKFMFLKSWNEWGEGNYVEPDLKYGKGYLNAIKEALDEEAENSFES